MRAFIAIAGFACVFLAPAWTVLACIVLLSARYRSWEALLLGFMMDIVWAPSLHGVPLYTLFAIIIVWVLEPVRLQLLR